MKVKYFLLIAFTIIALTAKTQNSCPLGYEERNVKCGKEIITKCVPVNYSCSQCWAVNTSPCPGYKTAGTEFYSSYETAYRIAENNKSAALKIAKYNCIGPDPRDYIIYLDDSKFCSLSSSNVLNNNGTNNNNGTSQTSNSNIAYQNSTKNNTNIQQEIEKIKSTFYTVSYTKALSKLGTIKQANPQKANEYQNNYGSKINYYEQIFSKEFNKGDNANPAMLRQYIRELDNLVETMSLTADTDKQSNDSQKQQYQNQANDYLNKAQDNNQSAISKQMNLDLAKTNAIMAGDNQQLKEIQNQQNQLNAQRLQTENQQNAQGVKTLIDLVISDINKQKNESRSKNESRIPTYSPYIPPNELKIMSSAEALKILMETFKLNPHKFGNSKYYILSTIDTIYVRDSILNFDDHLIFKLKKEVKSYVSSYAINISEVMVSIKSSQANDKLNTEYCLTSISPPGFANTAVDQKTGTAKTNYKLDFDFEYYLNETNKLLNQKCADAFYVLLANYKLGY